LLSHDFFEETKVPDLFVIELERQLNERGLFARQWCADEFTRTKLDPRIAQIKTWRSPAAGTLSGALPEGATCRGQGSALYRGALYGD
jgi:dTDP-4-dehydrorhamnose 3,5-epimerase-like enzyme